MYLCSIGVSMCSSGINRERMYKTVKMVTGRTAMQSVAAKYQKKKKKMIATTVTRSNLKKKKTAMHITVTVAP